MIFITFLQTSRSYTKDLIRFVFAWLDYAVYQFVSILMQAIFDIANFTLSEGIFEKLINRVYLILGIFMLFKITISLLTYLVNPDKISDKENGIGKLSVRVVLVLIMLIMLPSGFQILNDVQSALLPSIPRLILDSNSIDSTNGNISRTGKNIAASIWGAFYTDNADCIGSEPDGMTVYWNKGVEATEDQIKSIDMLKYYRDNVNLMCQVNSSSTAYQYEYTPLISTIAGGFMCYVLIGICITVAIRMFKMMILRMIAPIPIISYVDPKSSKDGAFSKWVKTLTSTWIELFINLGILYLIVFLVDSLLLNTTSELWNATQGFGFVRKSFFIVFVIMGLFAFARQAPKFIMDALGIKNQGNFMRAMGLSSVALGGIGATAGSMAARFKNHKNLGTSVASVPFDLAKSAFSGLASVGVGGNAILSSDKPTASTGYDAQQKYNAQNLNYIRSDSTAAGRMGTKMQTLLLGQSEYDRMEIEWKEEEEKIKYDKQKNAERKTIMDRASSKGLESYATSGNISNFKGTSGKIYNLSKANAASYNSVYESAMAGNGVYHTYTNGYGGTFTQEQYNALTDDQKAYWTEDGSFFKFNGEEINMEDAKILQHEINDANIADYAEKALVGTIDDSVITGADKRFADANNGHGVERVFGGKTGLKGTYGKVNNDISEREMKIANEKNSDKAKRLRANKKNSN